MYLYSGPSEIRTHTRTGLSRLPLPIGLPDHLLNKKVARDGVGPPSPESESGVIPLYQRAIKTRYCRHFSGRYCFALSFQASISFPLVQTVSTANIMSLIHAGRGRRLEELPQGNYPTLLHISCRYNRRCCEYLLVPRPELESELAESQSAVLSNYTTAGMIKSSPTQTRTEIFTLRG